MLYILWKKWITFITCVILSPYIKFAKARYSDNDKIIPNENFCFLSESNILLYCLPSAGEAASQEKQCSENEMKSAAISGNKVVVRALVTHDPPFVILCHDVAGRVISASGFILDVWKTLEEQLNFTTLFFIETTNKTTKQFALQNSQIQELSASKADAIIGAIIPTSNLSDADLFPIPVINIRFEAYLRDPSQDASISSQRYVKSLDPSLWGLTLATILIISLMLVVSSRVGHDSDDDTGELFIVVLGALLQQGSDKNPPLISSRVLLWTSFVFGLIMFTSYSAQLISSLTVHRTHIQYSSLREWFRNKEHRARLEEGSYSLHYLQRWIARERLETSASILTALELLSAERDVVVIAEAQRVSYLLSRKNSGCLVCRLVPVQGQIFSVEAGIVLNRHHFLKPKIKMQILKMRESGVLQQLSSRYWTSSSLMDSRCETETIQSVSLEHVASVLFLVGVSYLGSSALLGLEILYWRRSRRR